MKDFSPILHNSLLGNPSNNFESTSTDGFAQWLILGIWGNTATNTTICSQPGIINDSQMFVYQGEVNVVPDFVCLFFSQHKSFLQLFLMGVKSLKHSTTFLTHLSNLNASKYVLKWCRIALIFNNNLSIPSLYLLILTLSVKPLVFFPPFLPSATWDYSSYYSFSYWDAPSSSSHKIKWRLMWSMK